VNARIAAIPEPSSSLPRHAPCSSISANQPDYIRGATPPWSQTTNETAMNRVFGPYGWDDLRMAGGAGPFVTGTGDDYDFIFLEGSDASANELNAYLTAHGAAIAAWVNAGGNLFLNSAPNHHRLALRALDGERGRNREDHPAHERHQDGAR
jgi:hypothetical protein